MFGINKPSGSLFGNVNTSTPTTSTPGVNGGLNSKPIGGSLFGNNAVSTPSPGNTTGFNMNQNKTAGGLFGAAQNSPQGTSLFQTTNAASSTPRTSLFSSGNTNSSQTGGLFGNSLNQQTGPLNGSNVQPSGSLFEAKPTGSSSLLGNTSSQQPQTSLFGNNTSQQPPSLFSSGTNNIGISQQAKPSFFGNSNTQTTGGLFSVNKLGTVNAASGNSFQQQQNFSSSLNANPYGLDIKSSPILTMPESITKSAGNEKGQESNVKQSRKFSTSSASSANKNLSAPTSSTLIGKLTSSLKNLKSRETTHGIFSPSTKLFIQRDGVTPLPKEESSSKTKRFDSNGRTSADFLSKDVSVMKKLVIDSNRSAAKKIKLLNGNSATTKPRNLEDNEASAAHAKSEKLMFSANFPVISPIKSTDKNSVEEYKKESTQRTDYWCSPTIEQLKQLSQKQLANIPNFIIGRKDVGSISFDYEVDLTEFRDHFEDLFGKTIIFNDNKTVEVYPDPETKPSVGYGVNVPATITLQNVYPVDKKTKEPIKDNSRIAEVQLFAKRLRNMKDMQFISYNPFGGVWTFKVKHFSVWGLVNEEDVEIDSYEAARRNEDDVKARKLALPKGQYAINELDCAQAPPKFSTQSFGQNDESVIDDNVLAIVPVISASNTDLDEDDNMSLFIKEKPYEPSDVDEDDLEILDPCLSFSTSSNWLEQLRLAGHSKGSVFSRIPQLKSDTSNSLEDILFSAFKEDLKVYKRIKVERRMNSPYLSAKFMHNGKLIVLDHNNKRGYKEYALQSKTRVNKKAFDAVFTSYLKTSVIGVRSNKYPIVEKCSLNFSNLASAYANVLNEDKVLKLASILFDTIEPGYSVDSKEVTKTLLKKQRHKNLCRWIVSQTKDEISGLMSSATDLEKVFLYLCLNDVVSAAKAAIVSKNKHLSVLVSLLGSNDPVVFETAHRQLEKWKSLGSKVDSTIINVYQLLTGSPYSSGNSINESSRFSWLVNIGLQLYYGNIDCMDLNELVMRAISNPFIDSPPKSSFERLSMNILQLYGCPAIKVEHLLDELRKQSENFDVRLCWFFINMLRRSDISNTLRDKVALEFIEQLTIDSMYKEAIFVACFISDDYVTKQTIDDLLSKQILFFSSAENRPILERLQLSSVAVHRALAMHDKYSGDYLSEVKNLLTAGDYNDAELAVITRVGPELVIKSKSNTDQLLLLDQILQKFPSNTLPTWDHGLGVYYNYVNIVLRNSVDGEIFRKLVLTLSHLHEEYGHMESVAVACTLISETVSELFLANFESLCTKVPKDSLLSLPLGQPELNYLKKVLSVL